MPLSRRSATSQWLMSSLLPLLVIVCSVIALLPNKFHIAETHFFRPIHAHLTLGTMLLGYLGLSLAFQIYKHKKRAYFLVVALLLCLIIIQILHGRSQWQTVIYLLSVIIFISQRTTFTVKSQNFNLYSALTASGLLVCAAILYGTIGLYFINRHAFGIDFSLFQAIKFTFWQLITFSSPLVAESRYGHLFLLSLNAISVVTVSLIATYIFKPVKFSVWVSHKDYQLAEQIIRKYSSSVEDFFKLFPKDKHYYFNKSKTAVIAYKVKSGVALILDGPTGNPTAITPLLKEFRVFCRANDWTAAIIHADSNTLKQAKALGFNSFFIGNEAFIDINQFCQTTIRSKHFRYITNKAKEQTLSTELWQSPLYDAQLLTLRQISDEWLELPGRHEYTFIMGYFDNDYLRQSEILILKQHEQVIAYINIIPSFVEGQRSIDHMRHVKNIPASGMHFLLAELIKNLQYQDVKTLNLGLAPLSGIENIETPTITEQLLTYAKNIGSRYYSFSGLEQFKHKFRPDWQPRYIVYAGTPRALIRLLRALKQATSMPNHHNQAKRFIVTLSIIAALSYMSFFAANLLSIQSTGLVSELGSSQSSYGWLFNSLDVLSGTITIAIAGYGLRHHRKKISKLRFSLFALGGAGTIMAALYPISSNSLDNKSIFGPNLLHDLFSILSIFGFLGALLISICTPLQSSHRRRIKQLLLIGLVTTSLISLLLLGSQSDEVAQKFQLSLIALTIILLGVESTQFQE